MVGQNTPEIASKETRLLQGQKMDKQALDEEPSLYYIVELMQAICSSTLWLDHHEMQKWYTHAEKGAPEVTQLGIHASDRRAPPLP